jgi:tRNA(fMet)-specific endonuclease VapC
MIFLLDTDHLTLVKYVESERGRRLADRLRALPSSDVITLSIVSIEEQMRGWLAAIAKERQVARQVSAYSALMGLFEYFRKYTIIPFDDRGAKQFDELRSAKIRLGSMDLKIAATALSNQAVLLSANLSDFKRVPGLRVENWLD